MSKPHRSRKRPSTHEKHQQGQARETLDAGGEKADERRFPPNKRPRGLKGPWPPKEE